MKLDLHIVRICVWLAWLLAGPAMTFAQGGFAYQQWVNPNPRDDVPWDDSGVWVHSAPLGNGIPLDIDMDLDGTTDFQIISTSDRSLSIFATGNGEVIALRNPLPDLSRYATRLSSGEEITSLAPVPYEWVDTVYSLPQPIGATLLNSTTAGQLGFWGGEFGYLGVRIQRDGDWYYGWIRGGAPLSIVPDGIFYEAALSLTPNSGILAGQVPEPSACSLLMLGIGVFLMRYFRRSV